VDSSALITLAGGGALSLLALAPGPVCTVQEVYEETVEAGLARGFPDAVEISHYFRDQRVSIRSPRRDERVEGVSRADSRVLLLAEELGAADLLVNDRTLLGKAVERGLPARFTLEFVVDLSDAGRLSRKRRDALIENFVARGRYSREFVAAVLLGR